MDREKREFRGIVIRDDGVVGPRERYKKEKTSRMKRGKCCYGCFFHHR